MIGCCVVPLKDLDPSQKFEAWLPITRPTQAAPSFLRRALSRLTGAAADLRPELLVRAALRLPLHDPDAGDMVPVADVPCALLELGQVPRSESSLDGLGHSPRSS